MKTYRVPIQTFVCLLGAALMLASCADTDVAAAQPQVIRKKISSPDVVPALPTQVAALQPPAASAPAPAGHRPETAPSSDRRRAAASPPAPIVASVRPAAATPPAVLAPEPRAKKMAVTDTEVAALLNLQAQAPYNAKGKVDPFEALLRDESAPAASAKLKAKKRDPQSPLEKIDLGQLKLVAIIAAPSGNRALVEESSGKGYILREGTYVGLNSGKVVDIALDKVMVEEEYEDAYGKTITQKKEITLPKPPGEL
jgi:type IV pilus assembly protein PilP